MMRNLCKDCSYYCKENRTCQSKKCATGGNGKVSWVDRLFYSSYKVGPDCLFRNVYNVQTIKDELTAQWLPSDVTTCNKFSGKLLHRRYYTCSNCYFKNAIRFNYCPNCGYYTGG